MPGSSEVTLLLAQVRDGNREAANQLVPLVYNELRRMAGAYMQRERPGHTLQPTALVNEAYMRLVGGEHAEWQNRSHFFAIAAHTMRQVLLEYARRRHAAKRGGVDARQVDIDAELFSAVCNLEDVLAIDQVVTRLSAMDPQQGRIVELRFFAGLNVEETAEAMGISPRTVKREWRLAKAWLDRELTGAKSK
jgi:RNA polymerase sigma factor (TIGR02999 family)